ncbi:MAG: DUF1015 domain-containing protein [Elusimicrobiaceae bacterium]|nr:DUF1015 domain-containing protein [Elusimicrobiaceae bacterium]
MAIIKPFRGFRPSKKAELVASPPYDVLNSKEAREMAKGNPLSFLHIVKPEIDLPENVDLYDAQVYAKGRENLDKFIAHGTLMQDRKPCLYIYAQTMNGRTQYGLVAAVSAEEYDKGLIRKHELTRKDKEEDRTRHIETLGATTGPAFLTYPDRKDLDDKIASLTAAPAVYHFTTSDGITHDFWVIHEDKDIEFISAIFKDIAVLYIADGHHRSASAANVARRKKAENAYHTGQESYNYFLAVIFPAGQLYVMDYNRLVKDLNGLSEEEFFGKLTEKFDVEDSGKAKPENRHEFGMYLNNKWYTLRAKQGIFDEHDPVDALDVSILQKHVLAPILGIGDPRTDKRINFVGGIRGLKELEKEVNCGDYKLAFSMYPTSIEELIKVADANLIMPPKSTWFEPKLRSGLIIYKY